MSAGVDAADAHYLLGLVATGAADPALGDDATARAHAAAALAAYRGRHEPVRTAYAIARFAFLTLREPVPDLDRARQRYEEALALLRRVGHPTAGVLGGLAEVARRGGDRPTAAAYYREALALEVAAANPWGVASLFEALAVLAMAAGQAATAARLYGAAEARRDELGLPVPADQRAAYEASLAGVRAALGETAFAVEHDAGRRLPLQDAAAEATAVATAARHSRSSAAASPANRCGLTPREAEVLRLVAAGRSNREVAEILCLSERTVENHVRHLLTKLDLPSRTAAAAYAHTHGLA